MATPTTPAPATTASKTSSELRPGFAPAVSPATCTTLSIPAFTRLAAYDPTPEPSPLADASPRETAGRLGGAGPQAQQAAVDLLRIEHGGEAGDEALLAQASHPLRTGGRREVAAGREVLVADPAVGLQGAQQLAIGVVETDVVRAKAVWAKIVRRHGL